MNWPALKRLIGSIAHASVHIRTFPASLSGCIISANYAGLGNRLKCLISCMRIADKRSKALALHWPPNNFCAIKFNLLLENKIVEIGNSVHCLDKRDWDISAEPDILKRHLVTTTWRLLPLPEDGLPDGFSRAAHSVSGKTIDWEFDRIPAPVKDDFLTYVRKLVPTKPIAKEVAGFSRQFNDKTVSVGVRSWSSPPSHGDAAKHKAIFDINNVFKAMDAMPGHDFFVTCDSQKVLAQIIGRYGKRVLYYVSSGTDGIVGRGIKHAFIEMLLLSKNKTMLASYGSTFAEMAWWLGDCKARVEIIGDLPHVRDFLNKEHARQRAYSDAYYVDGSKKPRRQ